MLRISSIRRKSIRAKLLMDFSITLIGICVLNYFFIGYLYKNALNEKESIRTQTIANMTVLEIQLMIENANNTLRNITKLEFLQDDSLSIKHKINELQKYKSDLCDIGIVGMDGIGTMASGADFSIKTKCVWDDASNWEENKLDVVTYKDESYLAVLKPVKSEDGEIKFIVAGVHNIKDTFEQIIQVSGGEACFIASIDGQVIGGVRHNDQIKKVHLRVPEVRKLFKKDMTDDQYYVIEIEGGKYVIDLSEVKYRLVADTGWIAGTVNNKNLVSKEIKKLNIIIGLGIIIIMSVGLIIVYLNTESIMKHMRYIINYLGDNIKNEFKDSVPREFLEREDEIGALAREIKKLEEEMNETLGAIKESITYINNLNDSVNNINTKE